MSTGRFGHRSTFVPLQDAIFRAGTLSVPYEEDLVTGSPAVEPRGHISESEEAVL